MPVDPFALSAVLVLAAAAVGYVLGRQRAAGVPAVGRSDLEAVFDATPALIWQKDCHNRIVRVNAHAAAFSGKTPAELAGAATEDHYPDEAAAYYADDLEVIRSGRPKVGIVEQITDTHGAKRWVRTDKVPYRDERGAIAGVLVFALDITDIKEAEQRAKEVLEQSERAGRAKSDFLADVSHEIRTPLGVIMGFSELMQSPKLDVAVRQSYAEKILRNGRRLMKLIDEILDLAKVEQGRLALEEAPFDLNALLAEIASQAGAAARAKGLTLAIKRDAPLPSALVTDATRLRQILGNVLDNAMKFTDRGGIEVEVRAEPSPQGYGDLVNLTFLVRDTGKGLAPAARERLFRPLEQSDPTVARKYGGAGLGLSLSRRLALALRGDLDLVESAPQKGSTFRLRLPARMLPALPSSAAAAKEPAGAAGSLTGLKLLLVEDNPDIQEMVRLFLRDEGSELLVAVTGREGVDLALSDRPDLVLMDLQLPELDGISATAELRERGYRRPIVAMTAHAMKGQQQACIEQGFDDFLSKPLSKSDLMAKILSFTRSPS